MGYGHCTSMYYIEASPFPSFFHQLDKTSINYVRKAHIVCPYHVQLVHNYRSQIYIDPYRQPIKPYQASKTYHMTLQYPHRSHQ
jgi:hypothetical protein